MKYTYWDNYAWQVDTVIDVTGGDIYILSTSLALASSGEPHISFTKQDYFCSWIVYSYWDGSDWQADSPVGLYSSNSSLELDSSDNPRFSYTSTHLEYVSWNGSDWQNDIVDPVSYVLATTSLDLDSSGYPHISYYDCTNEDLKYAFWDGSVWNLEIVDSSGSVGKYTSLRLDPSDHAHISYLDASNNNLKYAQRYDTGIEGSGSIEDCSLLPLHPNPVSGPFAVQFSLSENAVVELNIYDISGRLVRQSSPEDYSSGLHQIQFTELGIGVYLYRMISGDFTSTQQFVVIE